MFGPLSAPPGGPLPPPPALDDDAYLFLDFDGTLVAIADTPDGVVVDDGLRDLLAALARARPGRVALLSGRSLAQLDGMLGPVAGGLACAGSHGAELRPAGAAVPLFAAPEGLAAAADAMHAFASARPGVVVEVKTAGVGLHFRRAPDQAAAADALAREIAGRHGLVLQPGKMMAEVRAPGSKGKALQALLGQDGAVPIAVGDDVTDEDAFVAARRFGGAGVLVGDPRATAARYRLPDVGAVHAWLRGMTA